MLRRFETLLLLLVFGFAHAGVAKALEPASFKTPPLEAKPTIWWYWGESVTTERGITQDLEAIKRVGFGGVVLYEQVFSNAPDAYASLSAEFMARVRFAAAECARLGLTFEVNVGPGYVAGGPWITPELGMQKLVFSEARIAGGQIFSAKLPTPESNLNFYRDVAVLAFPSTESSKPVLPPKVTSEPAVLTVANLFDPKAKKVRIPPAPNGQPTFITADYGQPFTARSIAYSQHARGKALIRATQLPGNWRDDNFGQGVRPYPPLGQLEASDDGSRWEFVCTLPQQGEKLDGQDRQTIAFHAKTARFFRLKLQGWRRGDEPANEELQLGAVDLNGDARVDRWEVKSAAHIDFPDPDQTPAYSGREVIDPKQIIDLTAHLSADGKLEWNAPPGQWTILRFGHTATGATIKHNRPESDGLECDKMSAAVARVQFENYVGKILKEVRSVPGARIAGVEMDSMERGSQNWTEDFAAQFQKRRGYDLLRFLPVMAGRVVGSREQSDGVLFDVRRTCADLWSDAYYGEFQRLCRENGMFFMAQAPGIATCNPVDNIQAKGRTDIPMSEFWLSQTDGTLDCKEASSAAHVYGKALAAAEAFTGSQPDTTLEAIKPLADAALAQGINRFVVLAYVHQPWDDRKPGVLQDRFSTPYNRHNTWWEYSGGFWTSLARASHLMSRGQPVVDVLYHLGGDAPLKIFPARMRPAPPSGYDFDVCGDEVLNRATVESGRVVLPSGMSYSVLVLAGGERLTLAAARSLKTLVERGAVVITSQKPAGSRSLADGAAGDAEVRRVADELWGPGQPPAAGEHRFGKGRIVWGRAPGDVLAELGRSKDFEAIAAAPKSGILFAHRQEGPDDVYFVANHRNEPAKFTGRFRIRGRSPQAWNPETGEITSLSATGTSGDCTDVPLSLEANGSLFVVFRDAPQPTKQTPPLIADVPVWKELGGSWAVQFDPTMKAPERIAFPQLASWTSQSDPNIRFYSGMATYVKEFELAAAPSGHVVLDLGRVGNVASVTLNGHDLGTLWKAPFAVEIAGSLRAGQNRLEVKVANVWSNRMIGDAGLPPEQRVAWVTYNNYKPGARLVESGLLGPVQLRVDKGTD